MSGIFEDHLGLDAIVAYVDGELSLTAFQRAAAHVSHCPSCAAEVAEQTSAQQRLRRAALPQMPSGLFESLASIPVAVPATRSVPGVGVDAAGRLARPAAAAVPAGDAGHGRRFRLGAGALVAGLAFGAVVAASAGDPPPAPTPWMGPDTVQTSGVPGRQPIGVPIVSGR
ncbi:anti-sigma factor family protein [Nakamurella endophytica]|uniref:Zinc finger protein n=1 Tax=Nakamurella endophytica TaxID=1748367 RepID=A0A917SS10_9ACTN|nr:zf-HC2 domain-containing protein [Nakamurella endophytica]GGL95783.1 hypothetical protein GCM10011594_14350 [Nakamurella endophytica]